MRLTVEQLLSDPELLASIAEEHCKDIEIELQEAQDRLLATPLSPEQRELYLQIESLSLLEIGAAQRATLEALT